MTEWFKWGIVSVVLIRAVYTDIKKGKIENRLMAAGLITALLCAYIEGDLQRLGQSIKMAAVVTAMLLLFFVIKGLGAGDIKLLAVLAAFFPQDIMRIVVAAFFVAAGIAVGRMLIRACKRKPVYKKRETLHFSIPIAIATGAVWIAGLL